MIHLRSAFEKEKGLLVLEQHLYFFHFYLYALEEVESEIELMYFNKLTKKGVTRKRVIRTAQKDGI